MRHAACTCCSFRWGFQKQTALFVFGMIIFGKSCGGKRKNAPHVPQADAGPWLVIGRIRSDLHALALRVVQRHPALVPPPQVLRPLEHPPAGSQGPCSHFLGLPLGGGVGIVGVALGGRAPRRAPHAGRQRGRVRRHEGRRVFFLFFATRHVRRHRRGRHRRARSDELRESWHTE
jgi:hypothetical protein